VTDEYFKSGKQQLVHDYVKKVHDTGLLAGVSTHDPDILARVEDSGWENDFYMTCFYNVVKGPERSQTLLGDQMLDELYLASDPLKMVPRIRQVKKTCLGFKILAAGRLGQSKASVEKAFEFAYANIKSRDAVIVGMFPILFDEVKEDTDLARKLSV
jgi:hypothetical protein